TSSSDANHASTSAKCRLARGVPVPACVCRSSNALASTAIISRLSGGSAPERGKNCAGRIAMSGTAGPPRHPSAASITRAKSMACVPRLVDDDDLPGHVLVPAATEHIAAELEGASALGDDADAGHLA